MSKTLDLFKIAPRGKQMAPKGAKIWRVGTIAKWHHFCRQMRPFGWSEGLRPWVARITNTWPELPTWFQRKHVVLVIRVTWSRVCLRGLWLAETRVARISRWPELPTIRKIAISWTFLCMKKVGFKNFNSPNILPSVTLDKLNRFYVQTFCHNQGNTILIQKVTRIRAAYPM